MISREKRLMVEKEYRVETDWMGREKSLQEKKISMEKDYLGR